MALTRDHRVAENPGGLDPGPASNGSRQETEKAEVDRCPDSGINEQTHQSIGIVGWVKWSGDSAGL